MGFHQTLTNIDIPTESGIIIGKNLIDMLLRLDREFAEQDQEWEKKILEAGRFSLAVSQVGETAKYIVMFIVQQHWDDLSLKFRSKYNYQWDVYVSSEFGIKPSTAGNYMRAIRAFFFSDHAPVGTVTIAKTNGNNRPEKDKATGTVESREVEWEPISVPITKLVRATPVAESGKMTGKLWSMLADPTVTVEQLTTEIYSGEGTKKTDPSTVFYLEGDIIVGSYFGEEMEVGSLNFSLWENPAGQALIRQILHCLGVKLDEDEIARLAHDDDMKILNHIHEHGGEALLEQEEKKRANQT